MFTKLIALTQKKPKISIMTMTELSGQVVEIGAGPIPSFDDRDMTARTHCLVAEFRESAKTSWTVIGCNFYDSRFTTELVRQQALKQAYAHSLVRHADQDHAAVRMVRTVFQQEKLSDPFYNEYSLPIARLTKVPLLFVLASIITSEYSIFASRPDSIKWFLRQHFHLTWNDPTLCSAIEIAMDAIIRDDLVFINSCRETVELLNQAANDCAWYKIQQMRLSGNVFVVAEPSNIAIFSPAYRPRYILNDTALHDIDEELYYQQLNVIGQSWGI